LLQAIGHRPQANVESGLIKALQDEYLCVRIFAAGALGSLGPKAVSAQGATLRDDAASGHDVWRFDGNPKDVPYVPRPRVVSRGSIVASPVFAGGRVFVAMGQSLGHGNGPSQIHAISPNGQGDVTQSRLLWTSRATGRVVGTPHAHEGLLYVGDMGGTVHCLDAATGAHLWKHETNDAIWGSLLLAGGRLYVGNVEGVMTVLRAGRRKEVLAQFETDAPLYSAATPSGNALYLATARRLYLIAAQEDLPLAEVHVKR
jgi:hypothetical protein